MASSSFSKIMEIPKYFLFSEGGIYSGGKYDKSFNYKIIPEKDKLIVSVWFGKNCLDKTDNAETKEFEHNEESFKEAVKWIEETYLNADYTDDYPKTFFGKGESVIP